MVSSTNAIRLAGLSTLLTNFELVIYMSYIVIFLEQDLFVSVLVISIIMTLRNFLQIFFRVPMGELSQIIGRKPLMLLGHFSYMLALVLLSIATSYHYAFVSIFLVAFGMSSYWPAINSYIGDFTPDTYGKSIGRIFQMGDLGTICATIITKIGIDFFFWDLNFLFFFIATIGFFTGLIMIVILPEGLIERQKISVKIIITTITDSLRKMVSSIRKITLTRGMAQIYGFQLILAFTEYSMTSFFPALVVSKGLTRGNVAEITLYSILIVIWFKPLFGKFTDRIDFKNGITLFLIVGNFAIILFPLIVSSSYSMFYFVIIFILYNSMILSGYMMINGETSRRAPIAYRGMAMGALGFYVSSGRSFSTVVLGPIWELIDLDTAFTISSISMIIITICLYLFSNYKGKHERTEDENKEM